jgi:hypothetical protein
MTYFKKKKFYPLRRNISLFILYTSALLVVFYRYGIQRYINFIICVVQWPISSHVNHHNVVKLIGQRWPLYALFRIRIHFMQIQILIQLIGKCKGTFKNSKKNYLDDKF